MYLHLQSRTERGQNARYTQTKVNTSCLLGLPKQDNMGNPPKKERSRRGCLKRAGENVVASFLRSIVIVIFPIGVLLLLLLLVITEYHVLEVVVSSPLTTEERFWPALFLLHIQIRLSHTCR